MQNEESDSFKRFSYKVQTLSIYNVSVKHLFDVCRPQRQVIQTVLGHISNRVQKLGVGDGFHAQLPEKQMEKCCNLSSVTF